MYFNHEEGLNRENSRTLSKTENRENRRFNANRPEFFGSQGYYENMSEFGHHENPPHGVCNRQDDRTGRR